MGLMMYFNGNNKNLYELVRKDSASIGSILLEWGYVTEDELEKAVKIQKSQQQLGQILVNLTNGRLTNDQVEEAFMEQKIRRNKASHKEIMAFNSKKKNKLALCIQEKFQAIVSRLEEGGNC